MSMRTLSIPAERHRGARVFWTLLILAVVVAIASPYMLGIDDPLQLPPRVARLVPVRPQIAWPPIAPANTPASSAGPPVPAALLSVEQDAPFLTGASAVVPRSRPTATGGASAPPPDRAVKPATPIKAARPRKAKPIKAARSRKAKPIKAAKPLKAKPVKPKQVALVAAAAPPAPALQPAPQLQTQQVSSVSVTAAQPQQAPANSNNGHAPKASHQKDADKPRRHP